MIFHVSSDPIYYRSFYTNFSSSVKNNYNNCKISFNLVGDLTPDQTPDTFIYTVDAKSFDEICETYQCRDKDARGYYALSRWTTVPVTDDDIFVCDIDIIAANTIDHLLIEDLLSDYQVINCTRYKPKSNSQGGMMAMVLRRDVCQEVKEYASTLLKTEKLEWLTDTKVRSFIYKNYKIKELPQMHDISKQGADTDKWFIFSKMNKFGNLSDE